MISACIADPFAVWWGIRRRSTRVHSPNPFGRKRQAAPSLGWS